MGWTLRREADGTLSIHFAPHGFDDLVRLDPAKPKDRRHATNLCTPSAPGGISAADAAYIYDTGGPDHGNLEAPVTIRFAGSGRRFSEQVQVGAGSWFRGFLGGP